jgi:hypothetical protein
MVMPVDIRQAATECCRELPTLRQVWATPDGDRKRE